MNEKILVVDDEKPLLRTIEKILTKEGYIVTVTDNSYDALDDIKKKFFDLVITDVRMPKMDGISLLKELRGIQGDGNKSRIIIITGYASEDTPIEAIKLGADDYIMKPFEMESFLHSVNRNIRVSRLEREKQEYVQRMEELHVGYKELLNNLSNLALIKAKDKGLNKEIKAILDEYEALIEKKT